MLLYGEVGHAGRWSRTVPMLLSGRYPHHVARTDLLEGAASLLHATNTSGHDQRLASGVGVPYSARTGLEGDVGTRRQCTWLRLEDGIDAHAAGEPVGRTVR